MKEPTWVIRFPLQKKSCKGKVIPSGHLRETTFGLFFAVFRRPKLFFAHIKVEKLTIFYFCQNRLNDWSLYCSENKIIIQKLSQKAHLTHSNLPLLSVIESKPWLHSHDPLESAWTPTTPLLLLFLEPALTTLLLLLLFPPLHATVHSPFRQLIFVPQQQSEKSMVQKMESITKKTYLVHLLQLEGKIQVTPFY